MCASVGGGLNEDSSFSICSPGLPLSSLCLFASLVSLSSWPGLKSPSMCMAYVGKHWCFYRKPRIKQHECNMIDYKKKNKKSSLEK